MARTSSRGLLRLLPALALTLLWGCSSEPTDPGGGGGGGGGGGRVYVITYTATATCTVASPCPEFTGITFDNGTGAVLPGRDQSGVIIDATNPVTTWTNQIQMNEGETVAMTATGNVVNGTLLITVSGDDGLGSSINDSDSCSSGATSQPCGLNIPTQQLP